MLKKMLAAAALGASACATTASEPINEAAAAILAQHERTGETTTCISLPRISQITAVDEKTLLIETGVNDYFVSDLASRCNGATRNSTRFEYTTSTSQLCRNEIIRVVDNGGGFLVGSCGMGSFEKLKERAPAAE